jgi:hypothetical protein
MRSPIVPLSLACLIVSLPAVAGVHHRAGTHRTADGSLSHAHASIAAGPNGRAARGSRTTLGSDGTLTHQSGSRVQGTHGGSWQAGRSVQRNPDGSMQAGYTTSGKDAAGGRFDSEGSRTRTADGQRAASRQTAMSGARGSYAGSSTRGDGTLDRQSTVTGAHGNTYQGQTSYTKGQGVSHSGTCTNAQGQTIQC